MEIATTKERILQFIDYKGISKQKFFAETGLKRGFLDADKLGTSIPDTFVATIIAYYSEINPEWLLTGVGPMLRQPVASSTGKKSADYKVDEKMSIVSEPDTKYTDGSYFPLRGIKGASSGPESPIGGIEGATSGIPLIPVDAMAGIASGEVSILEMDCERYIIPMFRGADYLIPVKGSSMYPKYSSGDVVACKQVPLQDIFFQWNKVYVLDTAQGAIIKRIAKSDAEDCIKIVSENPNYEPFDLHISQINAIAIVIGVVRLE